MTLKRLRLNFEALGSKHNVQWRQTEKQWCSGRRKLVSVLMPTVKGGNDEEEGVCLNRTRGRGWRSIFFISKL